MPKTRRTSAQRQQLKAVQEKQTRLADKFAFRMSPHIARWEAEGMTDPRIVDLLNKAGCPVPSEWKDADYAPEPVKQWTLAQYKRLKERAATAKVKMAMWAKRHRQSHARPFGDGAGLFRDPYLAGLHHDPNKPRPGAGSQPRWDKFPPEDVAELRRLWIEWDKLEAPEQERKGRMATGKSTPEDWTPAVNAGRPPRIAAMLAYQRAERAANAKNHAAYERRREEQEAWDRQHPEEALARDRKKHEDYLRGRLKHAREVLAPGSGATEVERGVAEGVLDFVEPEVERLDADPAAYWAARDAAMAARIKDEPPLSVRFEEDDVRDLMDKHHEP